MNIVPRETHDAALPPPLLGTPYDAAGRICYALTAQCGLTVLGVAIVGNIIHIVHIVTAPVKLSEEDWHAIDAVMCDSADVRGRWWLEDDAGATMMTRLAFEVG